MDLGSLLFLIIAILSVVADWMGKRRKAQSQADRSHRSPQPGGSQSSAGMPGKPAKAPGSRPSLLDQLQQELRRMSREIQDPELLDPMRNLTQPTAEPPPLPRSSKERTSTQTAQNQFVGKKSQLASSTQSILSGDEMDAIQAKKQQAARRLEEARRLTRGKSSARRAERDALRGSLASLRRSLRNPKELKRAFVLQTILEPPKCLRLEGQGTGIGS